MLVITIKRSSASLVTVLLADSQVQSLSSGRIFVPKLDATAGDPPLGQEMPQACVVVRGTGGGSLGPGARSRVPWNITRLDIQCFGSTPFEASQLHWAVYDVLTALERTVADDVILHDATVTGGPIDDRDPDTDWPYTLGVYDLSNSFDIP